MSVGQMALKTVTFMENIWWAYWHPFLGHTKLTINFIGSEWINAVYFNPGLSTFESVD
jgi:hypothetical protein